MTSNKPYLLRALNEWILDNGQTPYIIVDIHADCIQVPEQAIQDGKLVLNIAPEATRKLELGNESINFQARFSGSPFNIYLPMDAVMAIYARENGQGMMFAHGKEQVEEEKTIDESPPGPHLKLIK